MLQLYSIYHLNLAYSSISVEKRKEVIDKCFWPLLDFAISGNIPIAIEAPAYTVEVAAELDREWIGALSKAIQEKKIEFIGAGYSQLIAPLVPALVNRWNLKIGQELYHALLGHTPAVWYVNEQAYSPGIVEHYRDINAKAIVMEWNNPRSLHPEWINSYRYYPQFAVGSEGNRIPVIWNDSIIFQKFQRVAHGDIDKEELVAYLLTQLSSETRNLCLYGNDAEIFDFRPGRFKAEPELREQSEWSKIRDLYRLLKNEDAFKLVFPSEVLESCASDCSFVPLHLESASQPIPVKKQPKYNVTRWAVTGRNSVYVNSACFRIYRQLARLEGDRALPDEILRTHWRKLCYFWSSDFRTHITAERWKNFLADLDFFSRELSELVRKSESDAREIVVNGLVGGISFPSETVDATHNDSPRENSVFADDQRFVRIMTSSVEVILNRKRGMAIQSLSFPAVDQKPLIGTLPHGYFEEISLGADWYSANTILQRPGRQQITDLIPVTIDCTEGTNEAGEFIRCACSARTEVGTIMKVFTVYKNIPQIDCSFDFVWETISLGSFKTGMITLFPDSFDMKTLFYATHNGGSAWEIYRMAGTVISHDTPGSSIVTASHGLGATEGMVVLGDSQKGIVVRFDQSSWAAMPMIVYREASPSYFSRLLFSCGEMDESKVEESRGPVVFSFSISGLQKAKKD